MVCSSRSKSFSDSLPDLVHRDRAMTFSVKVVQSIPLRLTTSFSVELTSRVVGWYFVPQKYCPVSVTMSLMSRVCQSRFSACVA